MLPVLSVASEIYPLIKTGGLADVTGALPLALAKENITVTSLVPGYPSVLAALDGASPCLEFDTLWGGPARLLRAKAAGLDLLVLEAGHLYGRPGNPYTQPGGLDWPDNPARFAALGHVGAALGQGALADFAPSIVHAHDWQAGLAIAHLHYSGRPRPKTVMSVHNLAFQGLCSQALLGTIGLPAEAFTPEGVEFYGQISFLKAGLALADHITTVSPTYGAEILEPDNGMGMDGLLRARAHVLSGIRNGIDTDTWNPANDSLIATPYDSRHLVLREANKLALKGRLGLSRPIGAPLFGVVSRLSWQKGLDMLLDALPVLLAGGAQLALLGSGDGALEAGFKDAAVRHPGQIACVIGYDEELAHLMQAGSDALLVPSRFEPCGLTQLCALRYGAVPVVARVGGLADTIIDANDMALAARSSTGVQFAPGRLEGALRRTLTLWQDKRQWRQLQRNGMRTDVSWNNPAKHYASLYRSLL